MKFYLKIGAYTVPNLSAVAVGEFYRNETRLTTFSGGITVDRGEPKLKVSARIRAAPLETIKAIEAELSKIVVEAEFYYRGELQTKSMVASPISKYETEYLNGNLRTPYFYGAEFEMEEQ